jgi:hypothetical protein
VRGVSGERNNVVAISGEVPLPADQVLRLAAEREMSGVVVVGWLAEPDERGGRFYFASSYADAESVIYALQHANLRMLEASK